MTVSDAPGTSDDRPIDESPAAEQETSHPASSADEEQQRLRKLYFQQLRRMNCPDCGEDPFLG